MLDTRIRTELEHTQTRLLESGQLPTQETLQQCYGRFRERFGPEVLVGLGGEELLNRMHLHGSHDSLVYWLEFKDDEELPAAFGSISGGSALKFGVFKSQETGAWTTGSSRDMRAIDTAQAVAIATKHRDQLLAGVRILEALPAAAGAADYDKLQRRMDTEAPDVSRLAWGHKYFSLLFPERLDDYHSEEYQRHHLIRLLQMPPQPPQRYRMALPFLELARELGWPMNHLTSVLNRRNGPPRTIWRIGTRVDESDAWPFMRDYAVIAIGWPKLGDLSGLETGRAGREAVRQKLLTDYYSGGAQAGVATRKAGEIRHFVQAISAGDLVLVCDGQTVRGVGRATDDPYRFDPAAHSDVPHQRPVEWISLGDWTLPVAEGLRTTVCKLGKYDDNLLALERRLLDARNGAPRAQPTPGRSPLGQVRLDGIGGQVQSILERKGQVILYGPPGTGKTYHARNVARDLAAASAFGDHFDALQPEQRAQIDGDGAVPGLLRICTFHPAYGYEDFLEGYRPVKGADGQLAFERRDGIFKQLCADAASAPNRRFYLLIDEINRGDIPRIFGELLTLLEKDKRGQRVHLPLTGDGFSVPPNVFVIATMNTADRSIALLDTALRRRFGFIELMPDMALLAGAVVGDSIPLDSWLAALNQRILAHVGRDARNLQIGHAYLLSQGKPVGSFDAFVRVLAEEIVPLLEEYCYEDYEVLSGILGTGLVDVSHQRVRRELLTSDARDALISALLAPTPELTTRAEVAQSEAVAAEDDEVNDREGDAEDVPDGATS
ncbi:MAG: AAA domain-containing protein [Gammaproteobacteria bacterium]|jgi:5-methylcytosine-specific restriction protein B|nr:AAA domain-containing protein [Gammaproteobacteria bacterium]